MHEIGTSNKKYNFVMRKTVAELDEELQELRRTTGNVIYNSHIVWTTKQAMALIDKADHEGGLIKAELKHGFSAGTTCYIVEIYRRPELINHDTKS